MSFNRRDFMRVALPTGASAVGLLNSSALQPLFAQTYGTPVTQPAVTDRSVVLSGDTLVLSNQQRAQELVRLVAKSEKVSDIYLADGAVGELERRMAEMLGKEDAAFMPTGTLANNVAIRLLCGEHRHTLVQQESHLYQDESD